MNTTTERMLALCEKHNLTSLSISVGTVGYRAHCYVHWDNDHACASGSGETVEEAIANAIIEAAIKRSVKPDVPSLGLDEVQP